LRSLNVLDDNGKLLAKRLVTMKLSNAEPEAIVTHAMDSRDELLGACMFLLSIAARAVGSLETWQEALKEEENGI
jgi:hypothetical protein